MISDCVLPVGCEDADGYVLTELLPVSLAKPAWPERDQLERQQWEEYFAAGGEHPLCPGCGCPLDENHMGSCYGSGL